MRIPFSCALLCTLIACSPAVTSGQGNAVRPTTYVLERPLMVQVPFTEEVIRHLLLTDTGARWTPDGRVGNNLLSDIVSEVRLTLLPHDSRDPETWLQPGPQNQELAEEIIGLLRAARNGTYVPPSRRGAAVGPTFPTSMPVPNPAQSNISQSSGPGTGWPATRQDSTVLNNQFSNPALQGSGLASGNTGAGQPGNSILDRPFPGSDLGAGSGGGIGGQQGAGGWAQNNAQSQQDGSGVWGTSGLRPPPLALPGSTLPANQPLSGQMTGISPRPDNSRWQGNNAPDFASNPAAPGTFGNTTVPLNGNIAGGGVQNPATGSMPDSTLALINEMRQLRDAVSSQQQQLQQQSVDMGRLSAENRYLQGQLASATRWGEAPPSAGVMTGNTGIWGGDQSTGHALPDRRNTAAQDPPTGLAVPAAINGPSATNSLVRGDQSISAAELEHVRRQNLLLWLFLAASIGLNIYLAMIARGLYVRYGDLADELRETFTATA